MKGKIILAVVGLLAALWVGATALSASDSTSNGQPGLQSVANGPKDSPPGLERVVFIHYRRGHGKPDEPPGKKPPTGGPSCYGFIARGAKWKALPVEFYVGCNGSGLPKGFLGSAFAAAASAWDDATSAGLFNTNTPIVETDLVIDPDVPNGDNEVAFQDLSAVHAIAITYVWGWFSGPADQREILEFDMILDDGEYAWGDASDNDSLMDVQNIATHELGHALGLNDVYQNACSTVTMYGYSDYGETSKRTLEQQDITGLQGLYGQ